MTLGVRQQRNETLENDLNNICYINISALGIDQIEIIGPSNFVQAPEVPDQVIRKY